jgi:UPF0271 protein
MKYVIDTSAILSGKNLPTVFELYTSPRVINEIKPGGRMHRNLQYLISAGLSVIKPGKTIIKDVKQYAELTGDIGRLSETDIEILALAKELEATVLTDDYSMQNLATLMGVKYQTIAEIGIKHRYIWAYRCKSCGNYWQKLYKKCPTCGGVLRTKKIMQTLK